MSSGPVKAMLKATDQRNWLQRVSEDHPKAFNLFLTIAALAGMIIFSMHASDETISKFSGDAQYTTYTFMGAVWISAAVLSALLFARGIGKCWDAFEPPASDTPVPKGFYAQNKRDISEKKTTIIAAATMILFMICIFTAIKAGNEGLESGGYTSLGTKCVWASVLSGGFAIPLAIWWICFRYEGFIRGAKEYGKANAVSETEILDIVQGKKTLEETRELLDFRSDWRIWRKNLGPNGLRTGLLSEKDVAFIDEILDEYCSLKPQKLGEYDEHLDEESATPISKVRNKVNGEVQDKLNALEARWKAHTFVGSSDEAMASGVKHKAKPKENPEE